MTRTIFFAFLGGLGIFLAGLEILETAASQTSGTMKAWIQKYTKGALRSIIMGTVVTTILQSSSVVCLIILAFVGAGTIGLTEGIGLIMGANIGTTVVDGLVTFFGLGFDIKAAVMPVIGIGGLLIFFSSRYKTLGYALFAFGLMFLGLGFLKTSMLQIAQHIDIAAYQGYPLIVYVLIGLGITAMIHSSSGMALMSALMLSQGVISFPISMALMIGANIGTTITIVMGSIGKSSLHKQIALSHVLFNVLTAIIFIPIFWIFVKYLPELSAWISPESDFAGKMVKAQTLFVVGFDIVGCLILGPCISYFQRLVTWIIPTK